VIIGLVAGIFAAVGMARLVGSFLSGVSPLDPVVFHNSADLLQASRDISSGS
jgi:hypothetical protein